MIIIRETKCDRCGKTEGSTEVRWTPKAPETWGEASFSFFSNEPHVMDLEYDLCTQCKITVRDVLVQTVENPSVSR